MYIAIKYTSVKTVTAVYDSNDFFYLKWLLNLMNSTLGNKRHGK